MIFNFNHYQIRQLESEKLNLERNIPQQDTYQYGSLNRKQSESKQQKEISSARDASSHLDHNYLNQENRELRQKIRKLEAQLAEKVIIHIVIRQYSN